MDTTKIWMEFHQSLHRYLLKNVACKADADDMLQEIFIKIHLNLKTVSQTESVSYWVWKITRNTLIDYWKKKKIPLEHLENAESQQLIEENMPETLNATFGEFVEYFIELLPEKSKTALKKAKFDDVSQKELAKEWGISYSGAKSRVQRANQDLESLFRACCDFETDSRGNIMSMHPKKTTNCFCGD